MNKLVSFAVLVGGVGLLIFGISATNAFGSDVSRSFTEPPADKAVWTLAVGIVATVVGLALMLRDSKQA